MEIHTSPGWTTCFTHCHQTKVAGCSFDLAIMVDVGGGGEGRGILKVRREHFYTYKDAIPPKCALNI